MYIGGEGCRREGKDRGPLRRTLIGDPSPPDYAVNRLVRDEFGKMASSATVILVEDDAAVAAMYRFGLELHGFEVSTVGSGAELFERLDGLRPDVIVLDYQLPGANGSEVLRMIRADSRMSGAKVLMLSNYPPSHDRAIDRVVSQGAIAWLEKTKTSPAALALKLEEALGRKRD